MRAAAVAPLIGLGLFGATLLAPPAPAVARLWKPTPEQLAAEYVSLTHIKGTDGRVIINWMASTVIPSPALTLPRAVSQADSTTISALKSSFMISHASRSPSSFEFP